MLTKKLIVIYRYMQKADKINYFLLHFLSLFLKIIIKRLYNMKFIFLMMSTVALTLGKVQITMTNMSNP